MDERPSTNGATLLKRSGSVINVNRKRRAQDDLVNGSQNHRYSTNNPSTSVNYFHLANPNRRTSFDLTAKADCHLINKTLLNIPVPKPGTPVEPRRIKKAGPYLLGPILGTLPVDSIVQCLARREGTKQFRCIKILTLRNAGKSETQDECQGKILLHNEHSLLSLLEHQEGVVHHHGFFKDFALEEVADNTHGHVFTGNVLTRYCLVLDCFVAHEYNSSTVDLINLQHHVTEKKLTEEEAIKIFFCIVKVVKNLHAMNIVHRDLKLGNLVLDRRTNQVTLTNFCLGKYLGSDHERLKDQCGSPAYISPDVLCGKPYLGKPSDMWALGVVLYTMMFGQFPFRDASPTQLFNRIRAADYIIPSDGKASADIRQLIRQLLVLEPEKRLTASEVLRYLYCIITFSRPPSSPVNTLQVVPDCDNVKQEAGTNSSRRRETKINKRGYKMRFGRVNHGSKR